MDYQTQLPTYQTQEWSKYNLAKCNERRLFYELLNELCNIIPEKPYTFGRPSTSLRDLVFISCLKLYCNYSLRKIHSDLKLAEQAGYIAKCPHFNRISEFFNQETTYYLLQKLITISALPLKELEDSYSMDASGFAEYSYDRWMRTRFSKPTTEWRNYVKGHVCIGTRTNVIISAEVTYGNFHDVKQAPKLLEPLRMFDPKEVSADKAYNAKLVFQIIDSMGAMPFIPYLKSRNPEANKNNPEIWVRMYQLFKNQKELFMRRYHKRSNVETVFSMIKMRLGEFLKSKNYEAQKNELLVKFLCHNICCLVQEIYENKVKIDFKEKYDFFKERSKLEIV
jgi:transposase